MLKTYHKRKLLFLLLLCTPILLYFASFLLRIPVEYNELSAKNGDVISMCLQTDIKDNMLGYLDIAALPDLTTRSFEALAVSREEARETGKRIILFFENTGVKPKYIDNTSFRKKCRKRPPENAVRYEFSAVNRTDGIKVAEYYVYFQDNKAIYIEGWDT